MIRGEHITKRFGAACALENVTCAIPEGKIYGLVGPTEQVKALCCGCLPESIGRMPDRSRWTACPCRKILPPGPG